MSSCEETCGSSRYFCAASAGIGLLATGLLARRVVSTSVEAQGRFDSGEEAESVVRCSIPEQLSPGARKPVCFVQRAMRSAITTCSTRSEMHAVGHAVAAGLRARDLSWGATHGRVLSWWAERRSCETRLTDDGNGYELVIVQEGRQHSERFDELVTLLSREHELVSAWRAQGWHHPLPTSPRVGPVAARIGHPRITSRSPG
jgi:hypothetical protein